MKKSDIQKLNYLFEKMVSENASVNEQRELTILFNNFISEGRTGINNVVNINAERRAS